jgi:hypothetical protein
MKYVLALRHRLDTFWSAASRSPNPSGPIRMTHRWIPEQAE